MKYESSAEEYLKIATIIQQFVDGTANRWAWDDFISRKPFKDEYLREIQFECDAMSRRYPAERPGPYCNEQGLALLLQIADELRSKPAVNSAAQPQGE